jgi:zinc transport system substrate-binding protein
MKPFPRRRLFPAAAAFALALAALWNTACERAAAPKRDGKPVIFASIAPIGGLVSRIAGDRVIVEVLAGPEADPHGFSPTPKQLVSLGDASVFLTIGMPFESQLVGKLKSGTKGLRVVNLTEGVELLEHDGHHHHDHEGHEHENAKAGDDAARAQDKEEDHDHDHDHDHAHDVEESDTHVWLSPELLRKQAVVIEHVLTEIDPEGHDAFHANLEKLLADLDALDAELKAALAPLKGQSFYVFHGAFAYFARDYGLTQEAIETGGRSPEPKRLFGLIEKAKAEGVKLIIVQPQFDTKSAEAIAEGIGGAVVPVNPMGADVFETLRTLAVQVKASRGE